MQSPLMTLNEADNYIKKEVKRKTNPENPEFIGIEDAKRLLKRGKENVFNVLRINKIPIKEEYDGRIVVRLSDIQKYCNSGFRTLE
jgi:hypothetical protein